MFSGYLLGYSLCCMVIVLVTLHVFWLLSLLLPMYQSHRADFHFAVEFSDSVSC